MADFVGLAGVDWSIYLSMFPSQQVKAEQEEEFISNTLLKKIQVLKREKEVLAQNYEQEEECLTNDLSRKLMKVSLLIFQQRDTRSDETSQQSPPP